MSRSPNSESPEPIGQSKQSETDLQDAIEPNPVKSKSTPPPKVVEPLPPPARTGLDAPSAGESQDSHPAVWSEHADYRVLIAAGANLKSKDRDGKTALLLAVQGDHDEVVRVLKQAGEIE